MPRATRGPPGWRLDLAGQDARKRALARRGASRAAARCGPGASRVSAAEGGVAACRARLRGASTAAASPPEVGRTGRRGNEAAARLRSFGARPGKGRESPGTMPGVVFGQEALLFGVLRVFSVVVFLSWLPFFPPVCICPTPRPEKGKGGPEAGHEPARRGGRDAGRPPAGPAQRTGRGGRNRGASQRDLLRPTPAWNESEENKTTEQRVAGAGAARGAKDRPRKERNKAERSEA